MKIAVVGGGISGLSTAWLLAQKHEVHLFESEPRLGGHAHTVTVDESDGTVPLDTGFLVYNELTYPHLTSFFKELNVETVDTSMSLSVQVRSKNLEWNGTSLNTIFAQRRNLFKPSFHKMLLEILRFGREAETNVFLSRRHAWSLGELLAHGKYSDDFKSDYLLPIGAAIWSTPERKMLDFPASTFLTFFINHKLLQVNGRPTWKTVKNGSVQYVEKVARRIENIRRGEPVLSVERLSSGKVAVATARDKSEFDKVVLATHAPVTAKILQRQSDMERLILSSIQYEPNHTILHTDEKTMPRTKRSWASWNVYGSVKPDKTKHVSLSYYLNSLQPLPTKKNYFVTLNPEMDVQNIHREFNYSHPQFDQSAVRAQRSLGEIQGHGGVYYAGAWTRYGFHEDGILSGVNVAGMFGIRPPWSTT